MKCEDCYHYVNKGPEWVPYGDAYVNAGDSWGCRYDYYGSEECIGHDLEIAEYIEEESIKAKFKRKRRVEI